ncbi:MAG TPA: 50S ribosomal protein L5 [Crenotrichaceae bacterium]|nr:50S ribosomal protein L5 [Crenotrichaceae bacterium]
MARLEKLYHDSILETIKSRYNYTSPMAVPKITKVTLNMGVGEAVGDKKVLEHAVSDMRMIAGQKPVVTVARKSIAGFKIRDDMPIGCKVTLRRKMMYEFLDRLISVALPRTRDFRGLNPNSFDGRGNYSLGITETLIFPEIDYEKIDKVRGFDVCITTSANTDEEARALLELFGFPLKK